MLYFFHMFIILSCKWYGNNTYIGISDIEMMNIMVSLAMGKYTRHRDE